MSENSDKWAVPTGSRRKYCLRIGMHITECILDKTCEQCKQEKNAKKRSNEPQKQPIQDQANDKQIPHNRGLLDQKGSEKQSNGTKIRPNVIGKSVGIPPSVIQDKVPRRRKLKSGVK